MVDGFIGWPGPTENLDNFAGEQLERCCQGRFSQKGLPNIRLVTIQIERLSRIIAYERPAERSFSYLACAINDNSFPFVEIGFHCWLNCPLIGSYESFLIDKIPLNYINSANTFP